MFLPQPTLCVDCKTGNDFDVSNGNLANELSMLGEQLEAGAFVAPVTDNVVQ